MEKTLKLDEATARRIYPGAAPELKTILEQSFTKEFFSGKITARIKSVSDALSVLGLDPGEIFDPSDTKDERAYKSLKVVREALNEDWKADYNNAKQEKWTPYFIYKNGGFELSFVSCFYQYASAGSRLCFRTRELAEYAATQFIKEYNDFLL